MLFAQNRWKGAQAAAGRPARAVIGHLHEQAGDAVPGQMGTDDVREALVAAGNVEDDHARERPLALGAIVFGVNGVVFGISAFDGRREAQVVYADGITGDIVHPLHRIIKRLRVEPVAFGYRLLISGNGDMNQAALRGELGSAATAGLSINKAETRTDEGMR